MSSAIVAEGISKSFGDVEALKHLELDIAEGSFFVLLGPSGAGKTTTLRVLAGLEKPDTGRVVLNGIDLKRWSQGLPWEQRENAIVMSARFAGQKDHATLIRAAALLAAEGLRPTIYLAGEGKSVWRKRGGVH